jgi:hypothetical protein
MSMNVLSNLISTLIVSGLPFREVVDEAARLLEPLCRFSMTAQSYSPVTDLGYIQLTALPQKPTN